MKIGILTTSRADFGIYLPLLKKIDAHPHMSYCIFAGGTHMSPGFGLTYKLIEKEGFDIMEKVESIIEDDSPEGIAKSIGLTSQKFAEVWERHANRLDLLFVLGDRFEMFAAAAATIPFGIPLAHLHGGEITLGAIDNKFRNAITSFSSYHFVATSNNANRVEAAIGDNQGVYHVGALGVEGLLNSNTYSPEKFKSHFNFNIREAFVLLTYHPETINIGNNESAITQLLQFVLSIPEMVLCSLPNADTEGSIIRKKLLAFEESHPNKIKCIENLGQLGYYTAMQHCRMMIGNSSSGIIEAASFNKPVVNIGDRQKGREVSGNVIQAGNNEKDIAKGYQSALELIGEEFKNVYGDGHTSSRIIQILSV